MPREPIIKRLARSFHNGLRHISRGEFSIVWNEFHKRLYKTTYSFGLQRDLSKPFEHPEARIEISIRPLQERDIDHLMEHGELEKTDPRLAAYQRGLIDAGIPTCYVAVTDDDVPCYMQWLISSKHNRQLQDHFGNTFPELNENEALLEGAYMRPSFRGNRIMPAAMSRIAARAGDLGVRWTVTFVGENNIPSLKGCKSAGFEPYIFRKEQWRFFKRYITFEGIPEEALARYHRKMQPSSATKSRSDQKTTPKVDSDTTGTTVPKRSKA